MDMLQWILELPAAQVIVALLVMPWIGVALTHAFSVGSRARLDDAWKARADAALRWADAISRGGVRLDATAEPRQALAITVLQPRTRRAGQAPLRNREPVELDAA
jgi:hypothetical protein